MDSETGVEAAVRVGLADRYVIERELGRGGMATVYLARDTRLDRRVAIATDPRFIQFMTENEAPLGRAGEDHLARR